MYEVFRKITCNRTGSGTKTEIGNIHIQDNIVILSWLRAIRQICI
jgi:hypothetical protein